MEVHTKTFPTEHGDVEGIQVKWPGFNILLTAGSKGFLACPAIDVGACQRYGVAAAIIESTPENPIGTLERFANRKVIQVNEQAQGLGVMQGMSVVDALERIA